MKGESYRLCAGIYKGFYAKQFPQLPPYTIAPGTQDSNNLNRIIVKLQASMQHSEMDITPETTADSFAMLLEMVKSHEWLINNLNVSNILSQFNIIIQKASTDGNHSKQKSGPNRTYTNLTSNNVSPAEGYGIL